jgi:FlaG/FlaF family flagellin (archaellin)
LRKKVRILTCKTAISPLLATIILISITVAGGLVIYSVFFSTAGTMSAQLSIQATSIDIVRTSTQTLVSATIKNSGNKPITTCTVTVWGDSGTATLNLGAIEPGQSKSGTVTNPSGFSVTVGKSYPVKIEVTTSDGSRLDKSMTVTCTG